MKKILVSLRRENSRSYQKRASASVSKAAEVVVVPETKNPVAEVEVAAVSALVAEEEAEVAILAPTVRVEVTPQAVVAKEDLWRTVMDLVAPVEAVVPKVHMMAVHIVL